VTAPTRRVALVTGASGGLGQAICVRLLRDGLVVVGTDLTDPPDANWASRGDGASDFRWVRGDLTDDRVPAGLVTHVHEELGRLDVLVNNAGFHPFQPEGGAHRLEAVHPADWQRTIAVNLTAPFLLAQAAIPLMARTGWGRVVNITSRSGRTGVPFAAFAYSASKGGLAALTRSLAHSAGREGVTVNSIAPGGLITTPMSDQLDADAHKALLAGVALERTGSTAEIAAVVSFLASDDASYLTGVELDANGGMFMV
jgi:NAD(P)-dependent dehydrogenase (short-subunit alcohol dehydrogenase family)